MTTYTILLYRDEHSSNYQLGPSNTVEILQKPNCTCTAGSLSAEPGRRGRGINFYGDHDSDDELYASRAAGTTIVIDLIIAEPGRVQIYTTK